ncbi:MAG: hypothetical protein ACRD0P_18755, partial [Stackebrandtia sp.]
SKVVKTILTILSAAFGLGSVAISAAAKATATAMSITSAAVAGGAAVATDQIAEDEEIPLQADFPDEVLENLKAALDKLDEDMKTKEDELIKCLEDATDQINGIAFAGLLLGSVQEHGSAGTLLAPQIPDMVFTAADNTDDLPDGLYQSKTS